MLLLYQGPTIFCGQQVTFFCIAVQLDHLARTWSIVKLHQLHGKLHGICAWAGQRIGPKLTGHAGCIVKWVHRAELIQSDSLIVCRCSSLIARLPKDTPDHQALQVTYRDCLRTLHSQAVVEATTNFVPNRVLGASPPDISPLECLLPRSVRTTLAQLRSSHCRLLNSYKARITSGISDVCPECGVAPHSVEHLFNWQSHPSQLTVQDLWDNPAAVADFLNLANWG